VLDRHPRQTKGADLFEECPFSGKSIGLVAERQIMRELNEECRSAQTEIRGARFGSKTTEQ
jgi:hypothetical protein